MKFVLLIVVALLTLTGCASAVSLAFTAPGLVGIALLPEDPEVIDVADPGTGPGSVIYAETLPNLPITATRSGMNSARVVYRSVDDSEVSGTVFTPSGDAPEGGWPVISFGHGTTGILPACGPSLSRTLLGTADLAAGFTSAGYAVAVTDYEGLGHDGGERGAVHRYLDNARAGYNVIDAVRALRNTFPDVSDRWVAFGGSQGGGATWAANELAGYAPELDLLGSVSLAPGANMAGLVDKSIAGTLTADQAPLMQWVIESLARADPDIDRDDYRSGSAAADWDALTGCTPADASARGEAAERIGPTDFAPRTQEAADRLRARLDEFSVPKVKASAPMMVVYGDADTYIDVAWTDEALVKACGLGDVITIDRQPGKGHGDVDGGAVNQWIGERFAGGPVVDDCD